MLGVYLCEHSRDDQAADTLPEEGVQESVMFSVAYSPSWEKGPRNMEDQGWGWWVHLDGKSGFCYAIFPARLASRPHLSLSWLLVPYTLSCDLCPL